MAIDDQSEDGDEDQIETRTITDRVGGTFSMRIHRWPAGIRVDVRKGRETTARMNAAAECGEWLINDLWVQTREHPPSTKWKRFIRWLRSQPEGSSQRDRGIGTQLIRLAIEEARAQGGKRIVGHAVPETDGDGERLKAFYRRNGFRLDPPRRDEMPRAVAWVVLDLTGANP